MEFVVKPGLANAVTNFVPLLVVRDLPYNKSLDREYHQLFFNKRAVMQS